MFGGVAVARRHHQRTIEIQTDITIVGVTDSAMQLHRFARDQQRGMTGTMTGTTRGTCRHRPALLDESGAFRHHGLGEPQLQIEIDHAVLNHLKAADGDAELLACGEVVAGQREQSVTDAEQIGARRELDHQARIQRTVTRHFIAAEQARRAIVQDQARVAAAIGQSQVLELKPGRVARDMKPGRLVAKHGRQ